MQQHLIFTSGRSGSNYISNTLNLSANCVNYGEVLGEWTTTNKLVYQYLFKHKGYEAYLNCIYKHGWFFYLAQGYSAWQHLKTNRKINFKFQHTVKSVGIKDFLVTIEKTNTAEYIRQNPQIKIVYLQRKNILKRYISLVLMQIKQQSVSYEKNNTLFEKIQIDTNDLMQKLAIYYSETQREQDFIQSLVNHSILKIEYEQYFASPESIQAWNQKLCEFLEIKPFNVTSQQQKMSPNSLEASVLNYAEVFDCLQNTPYEPFLY